MERPLYVDTRGLTTRRLRSESGDFDVSFDFVAHELVVRTSRGELNSFPLADGLSVAAFYESFVALLAGLGIAVEIKAEPYGVPVVTPFAEDSEHASYDREAVERFWRALRWIDWTLQEFAGWFCGKTSPVHLFWHGLDLAVTRFSGERAPELPTRRPRLARGLLARGHQLRLLARRPEGAHARLLLVHGP